MQGDKWVKLLEYYAHSDGTENKRNWQLLKNHLATVSHLAGAFAEKFNSYPIALAGGLLHDIGKYSMDFQERLNGSPKRVDHSTFGAREALSIYKKPLGSLLAYVIAGHHAGLPDGGTIANEASLQGRLLNADLPDSSQWKNEILSLPESVCMHIRLRPISENPGFSVAFYIRMLYSCLVDADFLDTEQFMNVEIYDRRGGWPKLEELLMRFDKYMKTIQTNTPDTSVNVLRGDIYTSCSAKAEDRPGFFTLTVPTGGGKTLSSLSFALRHAMRHGLERILYVIPYTSIIEQNAEVFRAAVGWDAVLEHHSNYQFNQGTSDDEDQLADKLKLSAENWDAPIIVTTNVQFFESLFANRSSKCRKLHNLTHSVIILDEAQMLPTDYLKPCIASLCELVANYGSSVILCTATQPALNAFIPKRIQPREIAPNVEHLYESFKRVNVQYVGAQSDTTIKELIAGQEQVLCIVNTRRHAKLLYDQIRDQGDAYHLSARMCPAHRTAKFKFIRQVLADKKPCRLVSTQLIEAGVNIDFPVVYRSLAGIDSIAQAAGRCNREGRLTIGHVYVFRPEKHGLPGGWFSRTAELAEIVFREFEDPLSLAAVSRYFQYLYGIDDRELDKQQILQLLQENAKELLFPFAEVAEKFHIIDSDMVPIIIPWDDMGRKLVGDLQFLTYPATLARKLQPYTVQVYRFEFAELLRIKAIRTYAGLYHVLEDDSLYDEDMGLLSPDSSAMGNELLIF